MRLLQIDYFLKTAELLNFTKAAKELYISQPALSKQISLLEEEIGTALFIRTSRHVQLTAAGIQFRNDLLSIRRSLDEAVKKVSLMAEKEKKTIRIGSFDGRSIEEYFPLLDKKIHAVEPELEIDLSIASSVVNLSNLRDERIDWMIMLEEEYTPEEGESYTKLLQREQAIIYSERLMNKTPEAVTISDFSGQPLLIPGKNLGQRLSNRIVRAVSKQGIVPSSIVECDDFNTLYLKLQMGVGFSILANDLGKRDPNLCCFKLGPENDTFLLVVVRDSNEKAKMLFDKAFCAAPVCTE